MVKLISTRPVLYGGRMYEEGEPLPANDPKMVDAWLRAGSAKLTGTEPAPEAPAGDSDHAPDGQSDQEDDVKNGALTREALAQMSKEALLTLAEERGIELPRGAAKALILEKLTPALCPSAEEGSGQ